MLGFLKRKLVGISDEEIESEFDVHLTRGATRCGNCNKMYPGGHKFIWMPDSAHFYPEANTRQEMAVLCQQSMYCTGWCIGCVKNLPDDSSP